MIKQSSTKFSNKFHIGLLTIAVAITFIVVFIYFSMYRYKKFIDDFDDEDDYTLVYYEDAANNFADEVKRYEDLETLKKRIWKENTDQRIHYNQGEKVPITEIIVVRVQHTVDIEFFKTLLFLLKYTTAEANCLFIFAHDYFDRDVNELIETASLARYIQIHYPYSTQLFPEMFPGADQKLCTNGFQCEQSALRYETFAQKKHFWWWQMNFVFDELNVTQTYNDTIIFLDSDDYVLGDFIVITKIMEIMIHKRCPQCEILSLGASEPDEAQYNASNINVTILPWDSDVSSAGIAFNRTIWNVIKKYSSYFCEYDDYRWDASLRHLGLKREEGPFIMLSLDAPRVMKYAKCENFQECSIEHTIEEMTTFDNNVQGALLPKNYNIRHTNITKVKTEEIKFGGWVDDRDIELCKYLPKMD